LPENLQLIEVYRKKQAAEIENLVEAVPDSRRFTFLHSQISTKMIKTILLVGTGSFIGGVLRYLMSSLVQKSSSSEFPFGTFVVNLSGCLLIGIAYGLANKYEWFNADLRLFIATGICGGYTTFSAFAWENIRLLEQGQYLQFALYSIGSFTLGLAAAFLGLAITKAI
jgi:CrcB protein